MSEQLKQQILFNLLEANSKNLFWVDRYVSGPEGSAGVYETRRMTQAQFIQLLQDNLEFNSGVKIFKNTTGFTINKGSVVGIDAVSGGVVTAVPMSSSSDGSGSKLYVAIENILNGSQGSFVEDGMISGFDTSIYAVGDWLYWNPSTQTIDDTAEADKMFLGVVVTSSVSGTIYVSPTRNYSLVKGTSGQVALFIGLNHIESNTRFTFVDNVGTEVGFRFDDGNGNLTQVGCTLLNVETEGTAQNSVLRLANWSDINTNTIVTRKARGTKAIPSGVLANDILGQWLGTGQHNNSGGTTTFEAKVVAKEDYLVDLFSGFPEIYRYALTEFQLWLAGSTDTGMYNPPFPNNLVFSIDGNGQVTFKNYKLPLTDGTPGQIWKTDGAGNIIWANESGLAYTAEDVVNKATNFTIKNNILYPTTLAVYNEIVAQITALVNSSPATLDTLSELATALGNDPNFATTITTALGNRLNKTGDTITGDIANNAAGFLRVAWGSTAQRPSIPLDGMIRHNGTLGRFEFYSNGAWRNYARLDGDTFTGNIFALNLSGINSGDETTATIGALINAALSATPNDSDLIGLSAGSILKKLSLTSLKAFLKTYFDTIYTTGTSSIIPKISAHETFRGITTRNGSTTTDSSGGITLTVDASVAAKTIASTTYLTKQIRIGYYHTVVSTGHMLDLRFNGSLFYIGSGFRYVLEFGIPDTVYASGCRQFHGMQASTLAPTYSDTVQVDTLTDIVGIGSESTDTNLQVFYNDASGVASKIDLGASFPANRTAGAELTTMYSVTLYNEIGSSNVLYRIVNDETGAIAEGTISTNLPSATTALTMVTSRCMGGGGGNNNTGRLDIGMFGVYSVYTK